MPPFSSAINHQVQLYCNDNAITGSVAGPLIAEGKEIDQDFAPGVSDTVAKRPASEAHNPQSTSEEEEKDGKETNDESNLDPIRRSFEAKNLHVESLLDAFEDNDVYDYNAEYYGYSYHEQGYNYMHNQPAPFIHDTSIGNKNVGSLFTIPEQRVSFAGKVFGGILVDDLQVNLIPHVKEYTLDDKRSMWYTRKELKAIRKSCFRTARVVSRDAELYCPYFIRGLEHLVEQYRLSHEEIQKNKKKGNNEENTIDSENKCDDDDCCDSTSTSESRRFDAVEAVLFEQKRQRRMSLETNRIQHGGIRDPETIRSVYKTKGKTKRSQSIARTKALKDEACAKEWLMEAPIRTADGRQEPAYYYNDDDVDHCETHTTKMGLSKNVQQVIHKLVTPFLDMPEGDIYIEMGDEYFLTQV